MFNSYENIVALATSPKESTINLIRCSGSGVFSIYKKITKKNRVPAANSITLSVLYNPKDNAVIDQALVSVFKASKSYTGEHMIEFSTHGGELVAKKLISVILSLDCRLAEAGEFTYRAFINNKIDLVQAEAINSLIKTTNEIEFNGSMTNLIGELSNIIKKTDKKLVDLITIMEHELDFNENEITFTKQNTYIKQLSLIHKNLSDLINNSLISNEIQPNLTLCIAGRPNVGKSSLFNLLLGYNRAIVNKKAGTTRDIIDSFLLIEGTQVKLVDTAGIRKTQDSIEKEGVERSVSTMNAASLVIFVDDENPVLEYNKLNLKLNNVCFVQNKIDIKAKNKSKNTFFTSCKNKTGIKELLTYLLTVVGEHNISSGSSVLLNIRQKKELESCRVSLFRALSCYKKTKDLSLVVSFLYNALDELKSLRGFKKDFNVINNIFKGFCVGK